MTDPLATVEAVSRNPVHDISKAVIPSITLVEGLGVDGDAHFGRTVQHRSRARKYPDMLNLRQVHLIHAELHDELRERGMPVAPGEMGENVTTRGIELLTLPLGTVLRLGDTAVIELAGLRNPCSQLEALHPGLMEANLDRDEDGELVRKSGVMAVVLTGGVVRAGDPIRAELPDAPHQPLLPV